MSTSIEINGVNLIPIKDATSLVSYSKDYIGRLAREGKIVASQVGRQWFIDVVSLKNFAESASLEEEARKGELRAERKRELQAKEKVDTLETFSTNISKRHQAEALGVSFATLCLGLLVGGSVYTASLFSLPNSSWIADSVAVVSSSLETKAKHDLSSANPALQLPATPPPSDMAIFTSVEKYPAFETVSETRTFDGDVSGILLLTEEGEVKDASAVQALFSDDVRVDFTDDISGKIYLDQVDGEVAEFPFVTVPSVTESGVVAKVNTETR